MKTAPHARLAVLPLALAAAFVPFSSFAQTQAAPQLKEMVVSATRSAQPIGDVVADVTIIDREAIERSGAVGLVDILARVPGLEIARNGGIANSSSVFIRGGETRHTTVMVDGVKIDSQSTSGGASFSSIPIALIDRIEIVRGPSSAVYGSDAVAGVIQIFTKKGQGPFSPSVTLGYGSYNTRRVELGAIGSAGVDAAFDYAIGLTQEVSDGFNIQPNVANRNPDADGYKNLSANAKLGFQINRDHRLEATILQSKVDAQTDGAVLAEGDTRNISQLNTMSAQWLATWTPAYSTKLAVTESVDEGDTPLTPVTARSINRTKIRTLLFSNEYKLDSHLFSATFEEKRDSFFVDGSSAIPTGSSAINREKSQNSVGLGYGWSGGAHTLQLNARQDNDSEFGGKATGSAGYAFAFNPQWKVTAGAGTSFRVPTIYQRFSKYGVATLKPESGRNVEFGLRYAEGKSSFSAVVYRNRMTNLLQFTTGNGPCPNGGPPVVLASRSCYSNVGRAEYSGITFAGTYSLDRFNFNASLDLENPKNLDTNRTLARRSRQHGKVGVDTFVGGWSLASDVLMASHRQDSDSNNVILPGYTLVNFSAATALSRDWKLVAKLDNLTDKAYQTANGYAMPRRTLYVGVTWAPL
jgi:vitamin B12 transporter